MEFEHLKKCLHHLIEDYHVPGLDCIVYQNHKPVFRHTEGLADREQGKPMSGKELYYIFSMTKLLTCTAALQLWEQGKYVLEDPVSKYLPEYGHMRISSGEIDWEIGGQVETGRTLGAVRPVDSDGWASTPITVRHLFTMSAGLNYDLQAEGITRSIAQGKTSTREIVRALAQTVLAFEPGSHYQYSLCHDVLAGLVEVWSAQTFGDYLREHITAPLGMKDTFFPKSEDLSRVAALYAYNGDGWPERQPLVCPFALTEHHESGGAGLISTPEDYALFMDALTCDGVGRTGARILQPETIRMMRTNQLDEQRLVDFAQAHELKGYGYGLGCRLHLDPSISGARSPRGEFGWSGAAGAYCLGDPETGTSLVYFQHVHNWKRAYQFEMRDALYEDLKVMGVTK